MFGVLLSNGGLWKRKIFSLWGLFSWMCCIHHQVTTQMKQTSSTDTQGKTLQDCIYSDHLKRIFTNGNPMTWNYVSGDGEKTMTTMRHFVLILPTLPLLPLAMIWKVVTGSYHLLDSAERGTCETSRKTLLFCSKLTEHRISPFFFKSCYWSVFQLLI